MLRFVGMKTVNGANITDFSPFSDALVHNMADSVNAAAQFAFNGYDI